MSKESNNKNDIIKYRNLYMLEIIFNTMTKHINQNTLSIIIKNLTDTTNMVSIVLYCDNLKVDLLEKFINKLKEKNISISITIVDDLNIEKISKFKDRINQFRFQIKNITKEDIKFIYNTLKTETNDLIFIKNLKDISGFRGIKDIIKETNFIFNICIDNSIEMIDYWKLAKELSELKEKYPLQVLQDMPCAGIKYKNLKGICPSYICLMCIDMDGFARLCYKSEPNKKYNINDFSLKEIFEKLYLDYIPEVNCKEFKECFGGCPINKNNICNKYCYKLKGGDL